MVVNSVHLAPSFFGAWESSHPSSKFVARRVLSSFIELFLKTAREQEKRSASYRSLPTENGEMSNRHYSFPDFIPAVLKFNSLP